MHKHIPEGKTYLFMLLHWRTQAHWLLFKDLCPTQHKIGHLEKFSKPISSLGMEKQKLTQQKHAFTNQNKCTTTQNKQLEMWANAQRDGRPAKYRWHPLFNAAKYGWRPLLDAVQ